MSNSIDTMPKLGMGTYRLEGDIGFQSVKMALELGYRHIDTAQIYNNEEQVGQAIAESGIAREELFVTTKVWNSYLNKESFIDSVKESLSKLQLSYVDLLLIHWPSPEGDHSMQEYLQELQHAKALGLTKHIGVSNFTIAQLKEAMDILGSDSIFTNQVEVHPYLTNQKLVSFCQQNNIHITGYMPFAVGKVLSDPMINELADEYKVSCAEIVIAWMHALGLATIPSSTKRDNLAANLKALSLTLKPEDVERINQLNRNDRQAAPDFSPEWD